MEQLEIKGSRLRLVPVIWVCGVLGSLLSAALRGRTFDLAALIGLAFGACLIALFLPKQSLRIGIRHGWLYGPGSRRKKEVTFAIHDLDVVRSSKLSWLGDRVLWSRHGHRITVYRVTYPRAERERLEQALGLLA